MTDAEEEERRAVKAIADAARITGVACRACGVVLCGHDAVFSLVLGYKIAPRCLSCLASHMSEARRELRERALDYVRHHECFLRAWQHASELEGFGAVERPPCLWDDEAATTLAPDTRADEPTSATPPSAAVVVWDAGDLACGDLVLELRLRLRELPPGGVLELCATDPGAPLDLPAWCSMTGHSMVEARHPRYRIRRRP